MKGLRSLIVLFDSCNSVHRRGLDFKLKIQGLKQVFWASLVLLTGIAISRAASATSAKLAVAQNAAIAMAQSAASQVAAAVRPGATPTAVLNQAADSTDRIAALIEAATGQAPADKNGR